MSLLSLRSCFVLDAQPPICSALPWLHGVSPNEGGNGDDRTQIELWESVKVESAVRDGDWIEIKAEGGLVRIYQPPGASAGPIIQPVPPEKNEGPVTFETFEYDDQAAEKKVRREIGGGQVGDWEPAPPPGDWQNVVQTKVVFPGGIEVMGQPSGQTNWYVMMSHGYLGGPPQNTLAPGSPIP